MLWQNLPSPLALPLPGLPRSLATRPKTSPVSRRDARRPALSWHAPPRRPSEKQRARPGPGAAVGLRSPHERPSMVTASSTFRSGGWPSVPLLLLLLAAAAGLACCWWIAVSSAAVAAPAASGSSDAVSKPSQLLFDDEPSTQEIWSAVATSIAQWQRAHSGRHRRSADVATVDRGVCYGSLGCFREDSASGQPNALPEEPGSIGTRFYLSSRRSREPRLLGDSAFNASKPVKLIIHGFGSSGKRSWVHRMVDALLAAGDVNVLVVDWEKGATLPNYVQAAANARLVGRQVAQAVRRLLRLGAQPRDFHLVGFSLGAHVAGFAGAELRNLSRITGLDPAAPLFEGYDHTSRLDPTDAKLVDVIHSNGDSFLRGGLGAFEPLGHVDYYPNGGKAQLGCNSVFVGALSDIFWGHWQSLCHHRRALQLFTESANPQCPFPAFTCASYEHFQRGECFPCERPTDCSYMGYFADRSRARGRMFLMTRQEPPFCASQYKLVVNSSAGQEPSWGKIELELFAESGANETFSVTTDSQELRGGQGEKVLVAAHPAVVNITRIVIKYTKYRGWIYGGKDSWFIDKVAILDSFGYTVSYCGLRTRLVDGRPLKLRVRPEDCQPSSPQRVARLVWQVLSDPVAGSEPRPPRLVWTLRLEDAESASAVVAAAPLEPRPPAALAPARNR
ncbi:pancreatic triacylglycerol lipase-like [Dermacentor andersoni]|uniref:pancreatic triacylglycerol lipase-like n=1 Tax=Dermacentor andersoni TaxID=34620 RepID=UPI003B3A7BB4